MSASERRRALLEWFYADQERSGMTTTQAAEEARYIGTVEDERTGSLIYPGSLKARSQRSSAIAQCFADFKAHADEDQVVRGEGRPATWWYA